MEERPEERERPDREHGKGLQPATVALLQGIARYGLTFIAIALASLAFASQVGATLR